LKKTQDGGRGEYVGESRRVGGRTGVVLHQPLKRPIWRILGQKWPKYERGSCIPRAPKRRTPLPRGPKNAIFDPCFGAVPAVLPPTLPVLFVFQSLYV